MPKIIIDGPESIQACVAQGQLGAVALGGGQAPGQSVAEKQPVGPLC